MLIRRYFRTDRNNNLDVWAAISAWNAPVIYLFSFGSCTLCISLCTPHIHTLELCCCSCDSANCISQNPLPGGSIRFCQRDAIKGNWKWNTGGRVFIPVFQLLLQYFSCRQLALATGFFCTPQQLCYTSEIPADQFPVWRPEESEERSSQAVPPRPQGHVLPQNSKHKVIWREPPPQKSEYWTVKRGHLSELLVSDNHIVSSAWFSQAFAHYLISPVLNF